MMRRTTPRRERIRTRVYIAAALCTVCFCARLAMAAEEPPPNFVIIFADDLGYGDLGCYGHPTIRTPRLDRMAAEGLLFTQFYSAAPVCTPSRAGLLTGRLPIRSGLASSRRRVLFPDSSGGIQDSEITLAEALRAKGYATACVGKWHLGHLPQYLPTQHGFDRYFGLPYSNDMRSVTRSGAAGRWPPLPLIRGKETLETEPDQSVLTEQYTTEAVQFIRDFAAAEKPFLLYMPHTMPHVPLYASERFAGASPRGLYGDVVETIDWSTGQILDVLGEEGLAERTLVVFTSDNGPWLTQGRRGGSAGLLRGGKGSTWEGGMRVPGIAWWPGRIEAARVTTELGSTLDLLATCVSIAGAEIPDDRTLDSYDLSPVLFGDGAGPRQEMFFYRGTDLYAARLGPYKAHFRARSGYGQQRAEEHDPPLLYHLDHDPSERFNVAEDHPDVIAQIEELVRAHHANMTPGTPQLEARLEQSE